jgi:hypothetical protein
MRNLNRNLNDHIGFLQGETIVLFLTVLLLIQYLQETLKVNFKLPTENLGFIQKYQLSLVKGLTLSYVRSGLIIDVKIREKKLLAKSRGEDYN